MKGFVQKLLAVAALGLFLLPVAVFAGKGALSHPTMEMKKHTQEKLSDHASVLSVGESTIVVKTRKGVEATLSVTSDTTLRSRGGKFLLPDFKAGDKVQVVARKNEAGLWVAKKLLNMSLRKGAVNGMVKNLRGSSFEVETKSRGTFTVTFSDATKFMFDDEKPATLANLANGLKVNVKGSFRAESKAFVSAQRVIIHMAEDEDKEDKTEPVAPAPAASGTTTDTSAPSQAPAGGTSTPSTDSTAAGTTGAPATGTAPATGANTAQ